MQKMRVRSLGQEDTLEKEIAAHFNILAWEIPWTEEPGGLQFMVLQRVGHDLVTKQQQSVRSFVTAAVETNTTRQCQRHLRHWLKINQTEWGLPSKFFKGMDHIFLSIVDPVATITLRK